MWLAAKVFFFFVHLFSCNFFNHLFPLIVLLALYSFARFLPVDELKECLRVSIEVLLNGLKINDRLHEDMDCVDYLCV